LKTTVQESKIRNMVRRTIAEVRDEDLEMKQANSRVTSTQDIRSFVKSTYREFTAPFEAMKESLVVIFILLIGFAGGAVIGRSLAALSPAIIVSLLFEVFNVYLMSEIATDALMRMIPLFRALKEGNRKRAFIMAFNIVADTAQVAILQRTAGAVDSKKIERVISSSKFNQLGNIFLRVRNLMDDLASSQTLRKISGNQIAQQIKEASRLLGEGYVFLKLESKQEFAEAFAESFYPDDIDWDAIIEGAEELDRQTRADNEEIDRNAEAMARRILGGQ